MGIIMLNRDGIFIYGSQYLVAKITQMYVFNASDNILSQKERVGAMC